MRLVFLGSPPFGTPVLRHLLDSPHPVAAVVTRPDRPRGRGRRPRGHGRRPSTSELVDLARQRGAPVLQPTTTRDPALVAALTALAPQVLTVASYGELLRAELLDLAPHGALNVHASLLPRWRGASPVQRAILAGDAETGVSIQRMVLALDQGDVLLQERTALDPEETAGELSARLAELGGVALVRALELLEAGQATFTPQDPAGVTHAPKLTKEEGQVDWSRPATELERAVRAFDPWPGARTTLPGGRELTLVRTRVEPSIQGPPGVVQEDRRAFLVAAGQGGLELTRVKPAGKGVMEGAAFLRGAHLQPGARLGS